MKVAFTPMYLADIGCVGVRLIPSFLLMKIVEISLEIPFCSLDLFQSFSKGKQIPIIVTIAIVYYINVLNLLRTHYIY